MTRIFGLALLPVLALAGSVGAGAHDVNHQGRPPTPADATSVAVRVVDRPVLNSDGERLWFGRDVVGKKLVVVDFVYTGCGTTCPLQSAALGDLQDRLAARGDSDVVLISVTLDPVVDTPELLRAQARKFGVKPGWAWLTGRPKDIEVILTGMQAWVENPLDHPAFFLVGSADREIWDRLPGVASPEQLLASLDAARRARATKP